MSFIALPVKHTNKIFVEKMLIYESNVHRQTTKRDIEQMIKVVMYEIERELINKMKSQNPMYKYI